VAALIAGLVNGLLIARLNVPPFIATLGMFGIARGVAFLLSGGMPIPVRTEGLGRVGNGYLVLFSPDGRLVVLDAAGGSRPGGHAPVDWASFPMP
jgi:predicted ABC-type sugar transport system permease subunit